MRASSVPPDVGINLQCKCGEWVRVTTHGEFRDRSPFMAPGVLAFQQEHHGRKGHRCEQDRYRATCRPPGGCRNCGERVTGGSMFYCSAACRTTFEADHFGNAAITFTLRQAQVFFIDSHERDRTVCRRCGDGSATEVNHIEPVNGGPRFFTCLNHQDNLEPLCHACHAEETRRQHREGVIGPRSRRPHRQGVLV